MWHEFSSIGTGIFSWDIWGFRLHGCAWIIRIRDGFSWYCCMWLQASDICARGRVHALSRLSYGCYSGIFLYLIFFLWYTYTSYSQLISHIFMPPRKSCSTIRAWSLFFWTFHFVSMCKNLYAVCRIIRYCYIWATDKNDLLCIECSSLKLKLSSTSVTHSHKHLCLLHGKHIMLKACINLLKLFVPKPRAYYKWHK